MANELNQMIRGRLIMCQKDSLNNNASVMDGEDWASVAPIMPITLTGDRGWIISPMLVIPATGGR